MMKRIGSIITLGRCGTGDVIAFGPRGCLWTVLFKQEGRVLNSVMLLQNENGTTRTYASCDRRWRDEVIMIQREA